MSRGAVETSKLKTKLEEQLERLVTQLADLESIKDELSEEEYQEMKDDTLEQLKVFQDSLEKMLKGDMTLVDDLNGFQLAIQATISNAFQTPEIIKLFAKKQPQQLRQRLCELERDFKISVITKENFIQQKLEVLLALRKLGDKLSDEENIFVENNSTANMNHFEKVSQDITISKSKLLKMASEGH